LKKGNAPTTQSTTDGKCTAVSVSAPFKSALDSLHFGSSDDGENDDDKFDSDDDSDDDDDVFQTRKFPNVPSSSSQKNNERRNNGSEYAGAILADEVR
jgi:hypothetical protein